MPAPDPLDLHHLGDERVIGVYLLETADGLALQDCGPSTCVPALKERLAERGLALTDLRHLLLSHIHLDHAGAAGVARPRASGAPGARLRDRRAARRRPEPARSERAAPLRGRVRPLWGELAPVPEQNVHVVGDESARARVLPDARPRGAPRLLPRRRRHPLRGRRRRRADHARPPHPGPSRRRPRSTSTPGSARSTRSSCARPSGSR